MSLKGRSELPWLVVGDFNGILAQHEKWGPNPQPNRLLEGFQNAVSFCGLLDLGFRGEKFTWERNQGLPNWTKVRLNRALVSLAWRERFSQMIVWTISHTSSDHLPLFVEVKRYEPRKGNYRFKAENPWFRDPACMGMVQRSWEASRGELLEQRLIRCGRELEKWGRQHLIDLKHKIIEQKSRISFLKGKMD